MPFTRVNSEPKASMSSDKSRNFGLDVFRAIAIIFVLFSHGRYFLQDLIPGLKDIYIFGHLGVELFFVLSGFLIGGILLKSLFVEKASTSTDNPPESNLSRLTNFWKRRWFRTLPNYYLFLVAFLVLFAIKDFVYPLTKTLSYLVFTQTFIDPIRPYPFAVSWSLAVEEWFYLLFPIVPFLFHNPARPLKTRYLWAATLGIFLTVPLLLRIYYAMSHNMQWGPSIRNATLLRLDAIAYGAVAATWFFYRKKSWERYSHVLFWIGAISVTANMIYLQHIGPGRDSSEYCRTLQFSIVSLSLLLLLPLATKMSCNEGRLKHWISNASKWSYSMYLCHMLIIDGLMYLKTTLRGSSIGFLSSASRSDYFGPLLWLVFVITTFLILKVIYERFEFPLTNLRDRYSNKEHRPC